MVAMVTCVTVLVVTGAETKKAPAGAVTVAGGTAAGESLERLTTAPPGGAAPFRFTNTIPCELPPLTADGMESSDFSAVGSTVRAKVAEDEPRVAVTVTGVGVVTWPACTASMASGCAANWRTVVVAGTGKAFWSLLVKLTTKPLAGASALS